MTSLFPNLTPTQKSRSGITGIGLLGQFQMSVWFRRSSVSPTNSARRKKDNKQQVSEVINPSNDPTSAAFARFSVVCFVCISHQIEQFYSIISDSQSFFTQRYQIVRGCLSAASSTLRSTITFLTEALDLVSQSESPQSQ